MYVPSVSVHPRSTGEEKGGSNAVETTTEYKVRSPDNVPSGSAGPSIATVSTRENQVDALVETPIERIHARDVPNQPGESFSFPQRKCGKRMGSPIIDHSMPIGAKNTTGCTTTNRLIKIFVLLLLKHFKIMP